MANEFRVHIESPPLLSSMAELSILRAAYRERPKSALLRSRLAGTLLLRDEFDEVIALLGEETVDPGECRLLILAHLARETPCDDRRVIEIADRVMPFTCHDATRAQLLADQAKAHRRLGYREAALECLREALEIEPGNKDACKRLAAIHHEVNAPEDAIAALDRVAARGAAHTRLHAARALAHVQAGRLDEARSIIGFDDLHLIETLALPAGMASLTEFNASLAAELLSHPDIYHDCYGSASEHTWRIDAPLLGKAPMVRLLLEQIARTAERHVAKFVGTEHSWARARPAGGLLHSWCVLTDGVGYETWHVHQFGWLSGVYYVQVPHSVSSGDDIGGCIAFGLPDDVVGAEAAGLYGTRIVRPDPGTLMLFPSHTYHRTFPHGTSELRICLAFDIWPTCA